MPFVFVHGVNTRSGDAYDRGVAERKKFLLSTTFPQLAFSGGKPLNIIDSPYWGSAGAKPKWNNRSMPKYRDKYAAMGPAEQSVLDIGISNVDFSDGETAAAHKIAKKNGLTAALNVLILQTLKEDVSDDELRKISIAGAAALAYAEKNERPSWLFEIEENDEAFIYRLGKEAERPIVPADAAAMGLNDVWERLKETAGRVGASVGDKTSELLIRALREKVQEQATFFLGDAFVYFKKRWMPVGTEELIPSESLAKRNDQVSGEIPNIVLKALINAHNSKTANDPFLIVMAHSMGGNITYDLSTDFFQHVTPKIEIDLLVTVGSQFAMFQEIDMFEGVRLSKAFTAETRIPKPLTIKHWINCFDKNDIFGYNATAVFSDVEDLEFDTGFGVAGAHGGYFERFSFYNKLGKHMNRILSPAAAGAI